MRLYAFLAVAASWRGARAQRPIAGRVSPSRDGALDPAGVLSWLPTPEALGEVDKDFYKKLDKAPYELMNQVMDEQKLATAEICKAYPRDGPTPLTSGTNKKVVKVGKELWNNLIINQLMLFLKNK
mgnify:CR=1 FL=1